MPPDNTDDGLRAAIEIRATQPERRRAGALPVRRGALRGRPDRRRRRGRRLPAQGPRGRLRRCSPTRCAASRRAASVLDPTVVAHMLGRRRRDDPLEALTPREREVLELMAEGRSNRGIAEALVVTPHAVEKHVTEHLLQARRRRRRRGPPPRASRARTSSAQRDPRAEQRAPRRAALSTSSVPSSAPTRSSSPRSPLPPRGVRAADAVVARPRPRAQRRARAAPRPARSVAPAYLATFVSASATTK